MSALNLQNQVVEPKLPPLKSNLFQIDVMKVVAIFFVIMDHTFTHEFLNTFFSSFWERTAIPIFMIIMGFNFGLSFHRKYKDRDDLNLKEMYTREYFESRIRRYIIPYLVLYLIQTIIWIIIQTNSIFIIQNPPFYESSSYILLGYTPFWGPGMWFIPVLFTSILTLPIFYYIFRRDSQLLLLVSIGTEVLLQFTATFLYSSAPSSETFAFFFTNVLFMASAIGLGMFLVDGYGHQETRNKFYLLLFFVSVPYILIWSLFKVQIITESNPLILFIAFLQGDYHIFFFGYSAFLVLLGLNYLPDNPKGKLINIIRKISKSTYHILLTQILYFSFVYHFMFDLKTGYQDSPINYLWFFPLNLLITFTIGTLWHTLEKRFYKNVQEKPIKQVIYKIFLGLGAVFFVVRFFSQFVFLILFFP